MVADDVDDREAVIGLEDAARGGLNERCCGHCGSVSTREVPNAKPMPYWCPDCRSYFSVRTGTAIARSNVPLRKWAIAIYLCLTSLKSVSSMKLHRDIRVSQKTAWFMLHRIREAWAAFSITSVGRRSGRPPRPAPVSSWPEAPPPAITSPSATAAGASPTGPQRKRRSRARAA